MNKLKGLIMEMRKLLLAASRDLKSYYYTFFLLFLLAGNVTGRYLHDSDADLVLDGISTHAQQEGSSFLRLKGMDSSKEYYCSEQFYGMLPCSSTIFGMLFLIVVYEYLLNLGEFYVNSGGLQLFKILGSRIYGATFFQIIRALPEFVVLLVLGLFTSKEEAEEHVKTGVGLVAGSTMFLLTLLWGTCVIAGSDDMPYDILSSIFPGCRVPMDPESRLAAIFMILSLIPLVIIIIPEEFNASTSSGGFKIDILIILIVSVLILLLYFYKMSDEEQQKKLVEYAEVEHELLVFRPIQCVQEHIPEPLITEEGVQEHIPEPLITEEGLPNEVAIRSLFKDNQISYLELKELLEEIKSRKLRWNLEKVMDKYINEVDHNGNELITWEEFHNRFTKWNNEIKGVPKKGDPSTKWQKVTQQLLVQIRRDEEMMKHLTSEVLRHYRVPLLGPTDDEALRKVFESIAENHAGSVTTLRKQFMDVILGNISLDEGDAAEKMMNYFYQFGLEELIIGMKKWHNMPTNAAPIPPKHANETHQIILKEMDKSGLATAKAVGSILLGIVLLTSLAEPLIQSVQELSTSIGIPSSYVAFSLVPFATNARRAISVFEVVRQKRMPCEKNHTRRTIISLTFSEIYQGVFMNNILGMIAISSIIYFRGLTWQFSEEVSYVLYMCFIIGASANRMPTFPWLTGFMAYVLYAQTMIFFIFYDTFSNFWKAAIMLVTYILFLVFRCC